MSITYVFWLNVFTRLKTFGAITLGLTHDAVLYGYALFFMNTVTNLLTFDGKAWIDLGIHYQ